MKNQNICPKCNAVLNENVLFCSNCGSKIDSTSNINEKGNNIKSIIDLKEKSSFFDKFKLILKNKKFIVIGSIIFVAIAFVIGVSLFFNKIILQYDRTEPNLTYIKDDEIYFTFISSIEPFELTNTLIDPKNSRRAIDYSYHNSILISENNNYIYFPARINNEGVATYFYKNLSGNNKEEIKTRDAIRIDTEIDCSSVQISQNGMKFFYLKGADRRLFVFDVNENKIERIDSGVIEFYINKTGTYIVYGKDDDTIRNIDLINKESGRIDSDSKIQRVDDNASKVYYIKDDNLFLKELGKDRTKIASNITQLISLIDSQNIYYTKTEELSFLTKDFVDDDLRIKDENMENIDLYSSEYQEKERRDKLRIELEQTIINMDSVNLYYHDGLKETKVAEGIIDIIAKTEGNANIAYMRYNKTNARRIKMSELGWVREVEAMINHSQMSSIGIYIANIGLEFEFIVDNAGGFAFNQNGDELYYIDEYSEKINSGVLTKINFESLNISKPIVIDNDVVSYRFNNGGNNVLYFKNVKDEVGDVYQNGKTIATDVLLSSIYSFPNSSDITYSIDYDAKNQNSTLYLFNGDVAIKISDDVYSFVAEDNFNIAYVTDYRIDRQRGDAYLYDGSDEKVMIDIDVSSWIWKRKNIDNTPIISYSNLISKEIDVNNDPISITGKWYFDLFDLGERNGIINFEADGRYVIELSENVIFTEMETPPQIGRYWINGNSLYLSTDGEDTEMTISMTDGILYLKSEPKDDTINYVNYVLNLRRDNPHEVGVANAETIKVDANINIDITPMTIKQYFVFTPSISGLYTFEAITKNENIALFGILYDAEFIELDNDGDWDDNDIEITYKLNAGESYFIIIIAGTMNSEPDNYTLPNGNYTLNVNKINFTNSDYIWLNSYVDVYILTPNQKIFFEFTPSTNGEYIFESFGNFDTIGYLYDFNENMLAYDDESGIESNFRISHQLIADQTYYLETGLYYGDTGIYSLIVRKP